MGNQDETPEGVSYVEAKQQLHELFFANKDETTGLVEDPIALRKEKGYSDHDYKYPMRSLAERQVRWIDDRLYVIFDPQGTRIEYPDGSPANDVPDFVGSLAGANGSYPGHHPGYGAWGWGS